jgi:hypothetical protein
MKLSSFKILSDVVNDGFPTDMIDKRKQILENTSIETLWLNEFNKLEKEYDKWLSHRIKVDKGVKDKKNKKTKNV